MAKINRITRGSSSLVTLAELQSGSQLFTKTVINKTQITPELRDNNVLVKRAELVRRVIDRIVYTDGVSGVQVFAEYLLPVDSPLLLFIRGRFVDDVVSVTDDDAFLVPGKGFSETLQATDERLQLLIQAFRLFQDAALMQSRPALRLDKPLPTDSVSAQDLPSLEPGIGVFDLLLAADVFNLLVVFGRILQDAVQITDLQSFDIGKALADENTVQEDSVFSLGKVLADAVAEIDNVALRTDLLKQDSIDFTDRTALSSSLVKFDEVATLDQLIQAVSITKADAVILEDQSFRVPGKGLADQSDITDRLTQQVIKALADVATAIDLAGVFDGITYSYGLSRAFSVDATDQLRSATTYFRTLDPDAVSLLDVLRLSQGYGLPRFDDQPVLDRSQLLIGLGPRDSQELADQLTRTIVTARLFQDEEITEDRKALFLDKVLLTDAVSFADLILAVLFKLVGLVDSQTVTDANRLDISLGKADEQTTADQTSRLLDKVLADVNDLQDFLRFDVVKNLADTAITLDLAGVFDGITYSYGLNRIEDILVANADQFTRIFNAQRIFEDDELIQDEFTRIFGRRIFLTDTQDQPTDLVSLEPGKGFLDRVGEYTVYIDSPQDLLFDRELGQNFTSSQLFTLNSVTTDVAVTSSGTGAGQFEGFYAPAIPSVGPGTGNPAGGNYVLFTGGGSRSLTTVPLDTTTGQNVVFTYIAGNTSNGGDRPEAGENLILEYSTDLGTSFTTTATIWTGATLWPDGADWRTTSIAMPAASKTTATLWRWRETGSPAASGDNYGLFNIYVGGTSVVFVGTIPDADFYSLTKGLSENVDQPDSVRRAHTALRREADLLDLRTPDFERFSTSVTSSISTSLAFSISTPTRPTVVSNSSLWYNLAALTTSVFVISRSDSSWGMRSTSIGATWSPTNFGAVSQKFASDGLVGNTSMAVSNASVSTYKSTDQGATWNTVVNNSITGSQYYLPHWDSNRRIFIAFHRRSISGGKSPTTYNWRYDYSNNQLTTWTVGTTHIGTTSTAATGDFPAGVASGIVAANGQTALVNLSGQTWSLNSSVSVGTAFTNRGNNFPGWPGQISSSYLDNNFLTYGAGQFVFVYPASGGPVWRTTSTTLSSWYSSTLVGSAVPQGIFWDTSLSRYVIVGELSAGVPIIWTSTNAATWTSSTSTTGSVFVDNAVIQAALVPGTTTSGTSTLVGFEVSTLISSVLVIPLSVVNVFTTSFSTSVTNLPTPRGAELPSSTRYTVNKSARAGQQYTIDFKDRDGSTSTIITDSSVALTYTSSDTDRVGTVDRWRRLISANRLIEDAAPPLDTERFTLIKPISSVNVVAGFGAGNFGRRVSGDDLERTAFNINKSAQRSVAGSLLVKTQEGSLPFVQFTTSVTTSLNTGLNLEYGIGSLTTSAGVFTNSSIWDSGIGIVNRFAGTGIGTSGGFTTYEHFFFTNTVTRTLTTKSFSEGISSVTFRHIAGNSTNGGEQPDTFGEQLILQYLSSSTGTWVTATTVNLSTASWTQTSIALMFSPTRIRLAQLNCTTGANENYGVAEFSAMVNTIVYSTSVTSSFIITANFRESSVLISQSAQDRDAVGVIDFWTSITDYKRNFELETPALDSIAKFLIPATLTDSVSVEDSYSLVTDGLTYDGTKIIREILSVGLPNTTRVSGSDQELAAFFITKNANLEFSEQPTSYTPAFIQNTFTASFGGGGGGGGGGTLGSSYTSTAGGNGVVIISSNGTVYTTAFTVPGVYTWTVPNNVTFINVICTGAGAPGNAGNVSSFGFGGGGGGTGINSFSVSPGSSYTVVVGAASTSYFVTSGASYFFTTSAVCGFGGYQYVGGLYNGVYGGQGGSGATINNNGNNGGGGGGGGAGGIGGPGGNGGAGGGGIWAATQGTQSSHGGGAGGVGGYTDAGGAGGGVFSFGLYPLFLYNGSSANLIAGSVGGAGSTFNVTGGTVRNSLILQQVIVSERPFLNFTQGDRIETVLLGSGVDQPRGNDLERLAFSITMLARADAGNPAIHPVQIGFGTAAPGLRVSGDDLERIGFNVSLRAKQGANVTVSGVTVAATSTTDIIRIGQQYGVIRFSGDAQERISLDVSKAISSINIRAGSGVDQARGNVLERLVFSITKRIGDDVIPDDFLQTFDGLTYRVNMLEREVLTAGITPAIGIRVTGSTLENTAFDFSLRAKQGASVTVSGVTVAATSTTEIIRAGQQYGLIRFSGDRQERISFDITKPMTSTPVLVGADVAGYRHDAQSSSETIKFTVGKRISSEALILGFGAGRFGVRVSGDDLERTSFNVGLRAKQGTNTTVSGVTVAATSTTDIVRIGQRYGTIRFSGDAQERISLDVFKSLEAGSNNAVLIATDVFRRVSNFRPRFEDEQFVLGEKEGNFSYLLTQPRQEDLLASDAVMISNLLFRGLDSAIQGDLDPFGNINTMVSNGSLRMTDYVDIEYLENDYVGESRSFS
jgi:hypothetical protein